VNKTWVIGAGEVGAPEIGELAAGGMVIHDRSSRTGLGEFCGWKVVGRSGFSFARPAKAGAASVGMAIRGLGGRKSNDG
jgi:hypothetical protein